MRHGCEVGAQQIPALRLLRRGLAWHYTDYSHNPRWTALEKLRALVEGAKIVRAEVS